MSKEINITSALIENRIFTIRNRQVMIDRDLAEVYKVPTKVLNQAVKRNAERFPETFRFQLSNQEKTELVTICDRFNNLKHSSVNPHVFTEQGIAMLSAVLRSEIAIQVSIQKVNTQHPKIQAKVFTKAHDRFLIIDKEEVYHIGASLKDLDKKWFAFSKMDKNSVSSINSILELL